MNATVLKFPDPASGLQQKNQRFAALKLERDSWMPHYRDLQENFLPRRGRFLTGQNANGQANRGEKRNHKIINGTPRYAVRTLSSGMMSGLTSPARPWFRLATPDSDMMQFQPVKNWLWTVENKMRDVLARSNFYQSLFMLYSELSVFGTSPQVIMEDQQDVIRCYPYTIGSYCLGQDSDLRVNALYRQFQMTVGQLADKFGIERCSSSVQNLYLTGRVDVWQDVMHVIDQRSKRDMYRLDSQNMPVSSCYYEVNHQSDKYEYLRESGFEEWPVQAPRWEVTGEDILGSSPAMDCLGAAQSLQLQERRKAKAIDKLVDPPMVAHPDLRHQRASLLPGDVTYVSFSATGGAPGFTPAYQIKPELNNLLDDIRQSKFEIDEAMYKDLFLMMTNSDRREITAREIEERHEEKLLMLGPVLERLNDELLDPALDRVFSVMLRRGLLPPPPKELEGENLKTEYVSVLAQAQRAVATSGIERLTGFALSFAEVKPEALDKLDFDEMIDEYGAAVGVSPKLIVSDENVLAIRQQRAEQQQMEALAAAAEPLQQGTQAVKNLSEAEAGGQNALEAITGA